MWSAHAANGNSNSPQTVSIIGLDQSNLQTGLPVTLSIRSATNDAGAVSTCFDNASAQEFLNCTVGNDVFSFQSPLGRGLIGKVLDEEVSITIPAGKRNFLILDIRRFDD